MANLKDLIRAEQRALEQTEREWDRLRTLRTLLKDAELASMLGLDEDALAAVFVTVQARQKAAEHRHYACADALAEHATDTSRNRS